MFRSPLGNLFTGAPQTVFSSFMDATDRLNTMRANDLKNQIMQVAANASPQLMQQALQKGIYNNQILAAQAQYAPQTNAAKLNNLNLMGNLYRIKGLEESETYKYLPDKLKAAIQLQKAQYQQTLAKTNLLNQQAGMVNPFGNNNQATGTNNAPGAQPVPTVPLTNTPLSQAKGVQPLNLMPFQNMNPKMGTKAIDPTTGYQQIIPRQLYDPTASLLLAGQSQPAANAPQGSSFLPSVVNNPRVPNLFLPAGTSSARGVPASIFNPATGESRSTLSQGQRDQIQKQLYGAQLASDLLPAIKAYGTEGKFQAAGLSQIIPNQIGGVPIDDAQKYAMARKMAVEHLMSSTYLKSTVNNVHMMDSILDRGNGESRQGYAQRIDAFTNRLQQIYKDRQDALKLGAISLNDLNGNTDEAFLMDQYNKAMDANKGPTNPQDAMITMVSPKGQSFNVPREKAKEAMSHGWKLG